MNYPKKSILSVLVLLVLISGVQAQNKLNIYGYFSTRLEKVWNEPGLDGGVTVKETPPSEWSFPYFNVMMQYNISSKYRIFVNLSGADASTIDVRNFWGEYSASKYFTFRLGKSYRKFGLYNEILDAVPTYYGIEPPELFDRDHLIVSQTTVLMVYGGVDAGQGTLNYSLATDDGEGGPIKDVIPVGWDLNYKFGRGDFTLGTSGYYSGGATTSDVALGEGSPRTGVLPWMAGDEFTILGGYAEARFNRLLLQGEYWFSSHSATRDPANVVAMVNGANPNSAQLARFLVNPNGAVDEANVAQVGDYDVKTWYIRAGYSFESNIGEVAPYVQWDWYSNPETIQEKDFGGDNEAGLADDGKFNKATVGIVFRPVPEVAIKLDGSTHIQKFNGKTESYPEIRLDFSFLFGQ